MRRSLPFGLRSGLTCSSSYKTDFETQYGQYESQRELFLQAPSSATDTGIISFCDLIEFVTHLADCYPKTTVDLPNQLAAILMTHHSDLQSDLREKIAGGLVLLRKKGIIDSSKSVPFGGS